MTDLTNRMRTCAAHILGEKMYLESGDLPPVYQDAANLLIEAATEIELLAGPIDLGEAIEIIEPPVVTPPPVVAQTSAMWIGDDLKPIPNASPSRNACPKCDSRANKTVRRKGKQLWLVCPVCEHAWAR